MTIPEQSLPIPEQSLPIPKIDETKTVIIRGEKTTLHKACIQYGATTYEIWIANLADLARMQARYDLLASGVTLNAKDRQRINGL